MTPTSKRKAQWPDFAGNDLYEGDVIEHPASRDRGTIYYEGGSVQEWYVQYSPRESLPLRFQIDDRGMAVKVDQK